MLNCVVIIIKIYRYYAGGNSQNTFNLLRSLISPVASNIIKKKKKNYACYIINRTTDYCK